VVHADVRRAVSAPEPYGPTRDAPAEPVRRHPTGRVRPLGQGPGFLPGLLGDEGQGDDAGDYSAADVVEYLLKEADPGQATRWGDGSGRVGHVDGDAAPITPWRVRTTVFAGTLD
jgi:hypothetical protein